MKSKNRVILIFLFILLVIFLFYKNNLKLLKKNNKELVFTGQIDEINKNMALVSIKEGQILASGDCVYIDLSVAKNVKFKAGDMVKVEYDGVIMESYPLGINTTYIELVK